MTEHQKLDMVHTNLCGPVKTILVGGTCYFMTSMMKSQGWCGFILKKKSNELIVLYVCRMMKEKLAPKEWA